MDVKGIFIKMFWVLIGFVITQIPTAGGLEYGLVGTFISYGVAFLIGMLLDHIFTKRES